MTERKVKLDRANKSILLRALGDVYYGQRANGGSTEVTGRLILRVNDLPAGGKLTMSAAEYRLAKAALNQLRTQRLAEGGYTDAVAQPPGAGRVHYCAAACDAHACPRRPRADACLRLACQDAREKGALDGARQSRFPFHLAHAYGDN